MVRVKLRCLSSYDETGLLTFNFHRLLDPDFFDFIYYSSHRE